MNTAGQLQRMLLPDPALSMAGWSASYLYEPAGTVSGDYVDLVPHHDRLYFMLGDVSGKGVAAALLMAELHAMFRTLIPFDLPLEELMRRASALLCASSLPAQYATMVCGRLEVDGTVLISNAGHPPPIFIAGRRRVDVRATGLPMGLFCESQFTTARLNFAAQDTLLLFTDGLTEGRDPLGEEYGSDRVSIAAQRHAGQALPEFVGAQYADQALFRNGAPNTDDLTILALRRKPQPSVL